MKSVDYSKVESLAQLFRIVYDASECNLKSFAKLFGCNTTQVSRILSGEVIVIKEEIAERFCDIFGIPRSEYERIAGLTKVGFQATPTPTMQVATQPEVEWMQGFSVFLKNLQATGVQKIEIVIDDIEIRVNF